MKKFFNYKIKLTPEIGCPVEHIEKCAADRYWADWLPYLASKYKKMYPNFQIEVSLQN
jgi:hypothetical protein